MSMNNLTAELINFIEGEIMPRYEGFDKAHNRTHAFTVMSQSLQLTKFYDVDVAMVYTIAAYHDLGLGEGRETHHTASARIVREDKRLRQFFTPEQIETIADAVEDHRASAAHEPRTIYGKIVAEADRIIEPETIMARTVQYGLARYPSLTKEEHIERAVAHIKDKYGAGGYIRLWIPESPNAARLEEFRRMIAREDELRSSLEAIYMSEADGMPMPPSAQ